MKSDRSSTESKQENNDHHSFHQEAKTMSQTLVTQEFGIILAIKGNKPAVLNQDFLKYSGIIPDEWELARAPINTNNGSQVTYTNGLSIVAEPSRVIFIESIEDKTAASILVPNIARNYVKSLPNVEYQAVGINPRGYITCTQDLDSARQYIAEKLLSSGTWQEEGTAPMRATLNLAYTLERGPFYLSINEAALRNPDETTTPIVLFSGSFSYELSGETGAQRLENLHQAIDNWQDDLETYASIIKTKFISHSDESTLLVPNVFAMSAAI